MEKISLLLIAVITTVSTFAQTAGTFTDSRDGHVYKTVKIGNQVWMAENLAYKPSNGNYWAYDEDQNNVSKYGYLYDWNKALKVAPAGWHLPTEAELETLFNHIGGEGEKAYKALIKGGTSNFNILTGGWRYDDGTFSFKGFNAGFWAATNLDSTNADYYFLYSENKDAGIDYNLKSIALSIRLLKD